MRLTLTCLAFAAALFGPAARAADAPARPHILGVSHIGLWVKDIEASRQFYKQYLGFDEPYSLKSKDGSLHLTWIKINDRQSVELFPVSDKTPKNGDNLYHIALETDDAQGMRDYLAAHGVKGPGGKDLAATIKPGQIGNLGYFCEDPDGHIVEIVQYMPEGWTLKHKGEAMPDTRISSRISHCGITVGNLEKSLRFYRDILGMKEFWRGSNNTKFVSWDNVRTPEGKDYLELMLYDKPPTLDRIHTMNHFCLEVPDVEKSYAILQGRTLPAGCKPTSEPKTGVNQKRQINCFDPDGTRVEIMNDHTLTGKDPKWSTLPPPSLD